MTINKEQILQTIRSIPEKIKANPLRYFIILLGFVLVGSALLLILTPEPPESTPVTIEGISSGITKPPENVRVVMNISQDEVDFPKTLGVYTGTPSYSSTRNFAQQVAESLSLPQDTSPYQVSTWTDYETKRSLSFLEHENKLMYVVSIPEISDDNQEIVIEPAINAASAFIKQIPGYPELSPLRREITFLAQESRTASAGTAETIVIPFTFLIDNYPAYYSAARKSLATIQVGFNYEIKKAEFYPPPPMATKIADKNILPLSKIREKIAGGSAEIIEAGNLAANFEITSLKTITVNNLELEYRYSPRTQAYYPYFRIEAEGESAGSEFDNVFLTFITPAIETTSGF